MNQEFLLLNIAVFAASALQSATGIGFGVIAGPILLVALNDGSAIQVSIVLNLLIAALLAPSIRRNADGPLLKKLLIGLLAGAPIGYLIFLNLDIELLKAFAAIVVTFTLIVTIRGYQASADRSKVAPGAREQISIGVIAGVMGASLAMPGPIPAAWMSVKGFGKETIRATVLMMFVFAYSFSLALQFVGSGIGTDTVRLCLVLVPSTIGGIVAGRLLAHRISERTFRRILVLVLLATALALLWSVNLSGLLI